METSCSMIGCKNSSANSNSLQFFPFPHDFDLCMLWVKSCCNPKLLEEFAYGGVQPFFEKFICSIHFSDSCFDIVQTLSKRLKNYALPTLNLNTAEVNSIAVEIKKENDEAVDIRDNMIKQEFSNEVVKEEIIKRQPKDEVLPLLLIEREELIFHDANFQHSTSRKSQQTYKKGLDMTLENSDQQSIRNRLNALRNAQKRANETQEERETRLYKNAVRAAFRRKMESEEEQIERRKKNALRAALRRNNETEEQRAERRLKDRIRSAVRRQQETTVQSQTRKYNDAVRAAFRRRNETEEQKERRRVFDIMRAARKRSNETEEQRRRRLEADRQRAAKRRMLKKICKSVTDFKNMFSSEMSTSDSSILSGSNDHSYMHLITQSVDNETLGSDNSFDSFNDRSNSNDSESISNDNFTNFN